MSLSELHDVVAELQTCLAMARLEKINAPHPTLCQLIFHSGGADHVILIGLAAGRTRLHLIGSKLPVPSSPPAWVMKCRREIQSARLKEIALPTSDRVVRLTFSAGAHHPERTLLAELFGKRGRLLLLDESGSVLYSLIGEAAVGESYAFPGNRSIAPPLPSRLPPPDQHTLAANHAAESIFIDALDDNEFITLKTDAMRRVSVQYKKLTKLVENLRNDFERTNAWQSLQHQAEVLKANLGRVHKGESHVDLPDYGQPDSPLVAIGLDPALSPQQNMSRLFTKSRRLASGRQKIQVRLAESETALSTCKQLIELIEGAENLAALHEIVDTHRLSPAAYGPARKPKTGSKRLPYKQYQSATGRVILVGRSARDNHALTFQVAHGGDLWLHAHGAAGSHVVVPLSRGQEIDEQTLLDAATLAAHRSELKNSDRVEVTYTYAKHVHSIKGAAPGLVSVAKAKTILIRLEPARLKRLAESAKN
jgi:predicted ribosome quality control (RQC) complex YloA/Tae2 family protein